MVTRKQVLKGMAGLVAAGSTPALAVSSSELSPRARGMLLAAKSFYIGGAKAYPTDGLVFRFEAENQGDIFGQTKLNAVVGGPMTSSSKFTSSNTEYDGKSLILKYGWVGGNDISVDNTSLSDKFVSEITCIGFCGSPVNETIGTSFCVFGSYYGIYEVMDGYWGARFQARFSGSMLYTETIFHPYGNDHGKKKFDFATYAMTLKSSGEAVFFKDGAVIYSKKIDFTEKEVGTNTKISIGKEGASSKQIYNEMAYNRILTTEEIKLITNINSSRFK